MTRDIDVVVDPTAASIKLLVDLVDRDRFYMGDAEDAFLSRSMFNLIEPDTGWKVDFVIRKDRPFNQVAGTVSWPCGLDLDPDVLHGDHKAATGTTAVLIREYQLENIPH